MNKNKAKTKDYAYIKAAVCVLGGIFLVIIATKLFVVSETDTTMVQSSVDAATTMALFIRLIGFLIIFIGIFLVIKKAVKGK